MIFIILFVAGAALAIHRIVMRGEPSLASVKSFDVLLNGTADQRMGWDDRLLLPVAKRYAPLLKLDAMKQQILESDLDSAELPFSAQEYILLAWIKLVPFCILAVLFGLYNPMLGALFLIPGVIAVYQSRTRAAGKVKRRKQIVEARMPAFVRYVVNSTAGGRQVVVINLITNFLPTAGKTLRNEFKMLLADMRTLVDNVHSSQELGLKKFQLRQNSDVVRRVVSGLIDLNAGKDVTIYFQGLQDELRTRKNARLVMLADKRPAELFANNAALFVGIMIVIAAMVFGMFGNMSSFFGL